MSDKDELIAPFQLEGRYSAVSYKTALAKPFSFSVVFKTDTASTLVINNEGFDASSLGSPRFIFNQKVSVSGLSPPTINKPVIYNFNKQVSPPSIDSALYGRPLIYNLKQFLLVYTNRDQSYYGTAYLIGGVKYLEPRGYNATLMGKVDALNTRVTQEAKPTGINSLAVNKPDVSPRILYVAGIYKSSFGNPDIRTPVLLPVGISASLYGQQTIWFHTRALEPRDIPSYQSGYPVVFDPTRFLQPPSFVQSAVFGDTSVKNRSIAINVTSIFDGEVTPWAIVESINRYYFVAGTPSQVFGDTSIRNKTPSIFAESIGAGVAGSPAVGYRVRNISAVGFDRLSAGLPTLTKTPELKPVWNAPSSKIGASTVWFKNREIKTNGLYETSVGNATAWFRYRYVSPMSWSSEKSSLPVLTDGVRSVLASGFYRGAYGTPGLTHGVRNIEPVAIYKDFTSNHFVGRHQDIKPFGFTATLFGERIVPASISIYPLGFVGNAGIPTISLFTRYVLPFGYISVGTQGADRWGSAQVYNLTQYIIQNYQGDSGLTPPYWPEWTLIENRNKTIGVTGFTSQKFGYSQIDNNAFVLLPSGIEPPRGTRFDVSMIGYAVRFISMAGIEPPDITTWGVVHNSARVLLPKGQDTALIGTGDIVNTRRYYKEVGRIESMQFGVGMISYRIRTVDIESRYSIEPPYIQLPVVDLLTRYINHSGYETAGYGLASLSIHLRVITPRWTHRDTLGTPSLKNLTPELLAYGHDSNSFGQSAIRTQWRTIIAKGDNTALFGAVVISDTKQKITLIGWLDSLSSQRHTVTKTGTNPYVTQNIYLNDESGSSEGEGDGIYNMAFGRPGINQNVLYAKGLVQSAYGSAFVYSNNIVVDGGIGAGDVSTSLLVRNKTQSLSIGSISGEIICGTPRLSPHTIWAVKEAPAQAIKNHPVRQLHYVNSDIGSRAPGAVVGLPKVESSIRYIKPNGYTWFVIASPRLDMSLKVVKCEGFRNAFVGLPKIPFTLQSVFIDKGIYNDNYGRPLIAPPPYVGPKVISTIGIPSFSSGSNRIDNYIRYIKAIGSNLAQMGSSKSNDTPYMWQGLRIGEHVPLVIGGYDTSRYGVAFISLRVRDISLQGFNAFQSGYDTSNFYDRMTVYNADKQLPEVIGLSLTGIEPLNNFGYTDVKLGQHYIRPDGNSDQFRKGGYHA